MGRRTKDYASVSFHFFQRECEGEAISFSEDEFETMCRNIAEQPWPDFDDEETQVKLRVGLLTPFRNFERVNSRTARGTFQNSYSGHAFHNTEKGKISAQSLNQREFQYLLYLSDNGQIFVGAQYLGSYGGYESLRWGLYKHLPSSSSVRSYSYRRETYDPVHFRPKEVRISIASTGRDDQDNVLTRRRMVVLQRSQANDDAFEEAARSTFVPIMTSEEPDRERQLARLLGEKGLMIADDEDVSNCVMIADVNGKDRRFHVIGDSAFATRFPLSVPYNVDGHPEYEPTAAAILATLERQIIDVVS